MTDTTARRALMLALGMGLAATAAVSGPVGAQVPDASRAAVEAPRQVTTGPNPLRLYDIPALAVDPDDPDTIVMAVGDARNGGCGLRVSHDGGLSWAVTAPNLLFEPNDSCIQRALAPVMRPTFASDGTLYVALASSSPATDVANGPISMLMSRTPDLGITHETFMVAKGETTPFNPADYGAAGPPQEGNSWNKYMGMGVDPKNPNRVYVMWRWLVWGKDLRQLQGDFVVRPYFSTSEDGGRTWSKPVDVLSVTGGEKAFGAGTMSMAVGPDSTVYGFARESVKPVPTGQTAPLPRHLMFKSTDFGKTWETSAIGEPAARAGNPEAAVDMKTGKLYVAYEHRGAATPSTSPPNPQNIMLISSADGGKTWSKPQNITDDAADKRADQYYPGISVAPNGRVDVAWHDFRNDPFFFAGQEGNMGTAVGQRYWDVYYTYSEDGGATWAENKRLTNPSIDAKHGATFNNIDTRGPMGIASSNEAAYVAWADSRATVDQNEAEDAYMTRIRFVGVAELGATGGSSGGDSALWSVVGAGAALGIGGLLLLLVSRSRRPAAQGA
ncbi:MAG TPA: sialidase family protein, partial [Acidimicrobiales bacterium]|nr:sialidase family protein [Acidimicrobiales bacterium]